MLDNLFVMNIYSLCNERRTIDAKTNMYKKGWIYTKHNLF
jgi:hypothetical protein